KSEKELPRVETGLITEPDGRRYAERQWRGLRELCRQTHAACCSGFPFEVPAFARIQRVHVRGSRREVAFDAVTPGHLRDETYRILVGTGVGPGVLFSEVLQHPGVPQVMLAGDLGR